MNKEAENYFFGKSNSSERINFLRNLAADEKMQAEFSRYQNVGAMLAFCDNVGDPGEAIRSYRQFMGSMRRHSIYKNIRRIGGYAAAVALLIMFVHLYHVHFYPRATNVVSDTSLFVPDGQRVSLTLSDGTTVWLNARTRITYPAAFTGGERRVSIEGEAFFEVAENKEKPFMVSTNDIEIKVLGTTFNVCNYSDENLSRVSLLEGSLLVHSKTSPEMEVVLRPQEEATFRNQTMTVGKIPNNDYFLWKKGIYSFENEMLDNILRKLELYYDIKIEVKSPDILQWKYTVKFRQRDGIDEILRTLCKIYPLKINKIEEENKVIISK